MAILISTVQRIKEELDREDEQDLKSMFQDLYRQLSTKQRASLIRGMAQEELDWKQHNHITDNTLVEGRYTDDGVLMAFAGFVSHHSYIPKKG